MLLRSAVLFVLVGLAAWAAPLRAQTPALIPLTVELSDVSASKVPYLVAAEAGIYARNGLNVTQYITPLAADIAKGNGIIVPPANIGHSEGPPPPISTGGGSPVVVIMTSNAVAPQRVLLATTDQTGNFFRVFAKPPIKRLEDLKGKRVGYIIRGSVDDLLLNAYARRMGWDPDRDWTMLGNVRGAEVAAKANIDAFVGDPLARPEALKLGYHDIGDFNKYHFAVLGSGVSALKSWLPANRPVAAAFIKSLVEAIALVKRDKPGTIAAMEKWYGLSDRAQEEDFYHWAALMPPKPYPNKAGLRLVRKLYVYREMEIHPQGYFIDSSFVARLDAIGYINGLYTRP